MKHNEFENLTLGEMEDAIEEYDKLLELLPDIELEIRAKVIHNKAVVDALEAKGAEMIEALSEATAGDTVIIRSHGEPKEFYDELRVKEAMDQLQNGRSVTEIARKMNFSSPNFFCAFFKRHTGVTPSAYKKRHGFDV